MPGCVLRLGQAEEQRRRVFGLLESGVRQCFALPLSFLSSLLFPEKSKRNRRSKSGRAKHCRTPETQTGPGSTAEPRERSSSRAAQDENPGALGRRLLAHSKDTMQDNGMRDEAG